MKFKDIFKSNRTEEYNKLILSIPITKKGLQDLIVEFSKYYYEFKNAYDSRPIKDREYINKLILSNSGLDFKRAELGSYFGKYVDAINVRNFLVNKMRIFSGIQHETIRKIDMYQVGFDLINTTSHDFLKNIFKYYLEIILFLVWFKEIRFGR